MPLALAEIEAAARVLEGQVVRTPCLPSERLSLRTGADLVLKYETFQRGATFKDRGAFIKLQSLGPAERAQGVVAMSAGNHAQGVALHAGRLGIPATIVMPRLTPTVKVERTRDLGAEVVLEGSSVDEAAIHARTLAERDGLAFIHPFDDPLIIAGQGTIALEMLSAAPDLDVLVVPIGGGGLISGIATAAKALRPKIEVIGVQAAAFPAVYRRRYRLPEVPPRPTIAEGIAVKEPGRLTLPIIEALVDDVVLVEELALEEAVLMLLEVEKTVVEGAGAAGLAAVRSYPERFRGRRVGLVLCGGNIDSRVLSDLILRGLVRSRRLIQLEADLADAPGTLARVAELIGEAGGNIVEVEHKRAFSPLSVKAIGVGFTLETRNAAHASELVARLQAAGFPVRLLDAP